MNPQIVDALNALMARENQSASYYQFLTAYFTGINLPGYANRFQLRKVRKTARVSSIQNYMNSQGTSPGTLPPPNPAPAWSSPISALNFINGDQTTTTSNMTTAQNLAISLGDNSTANFVKCMVEEQVEEEATSSELLNRSQRIYDPRNPNRNGLSPVDYNLP